MRGFVKNRALNAGSVPDALETTPIYGTAAAAGDVVGEGGAGAGAGDFQMGGVRDYNGGGEEGGKRVGIEGMGRREFSGDDRGQKKKTGKTVERQVMGDDDGDGEVGEKEANEGLQGHIFDYGMDDAPRPLKSNGIAKLANGQQELGMRQAHARESGPLSLHTSDFDGYEGTETEVLSLEDLAVGKSGVEGEGANGDDDDDDVGRMRGVERTYDENEDAADIVVDNESDNDDDDSSVDGVDVADAAVVGRSGANQATSVNAELIEYYRQKELAEMRNGNAERSGISNNVSSLVMGNAAVTNTDNDHTGTRSYARARLFKKNGYQGEDGLLDSYPSTTITGIGDVDDLVQGRKGNKGYKVNEEASNNHVEGGYIYGGDEGDEEETGSRDTEREQMQQHQPTQGRHHYNVHFDIQTSPLQNHNSRPEGRDMRGSRAFRQNSPTPAPLISGYVQNMNNDEQLDADFDFTHKNHYANLNGSSKNGFQIAEQPHLDMTAFIQRAGRSKRGYIKYSGPQADGRKVNDTHNDIVHSKSRYTAATNDAQLVAMVPAKLSRTHDSQMTSRVITRRNGEAIAVIGQTTTTGVDATGYHTRALTSAKANSKLKSKSKAIIKTITAQPVNTVRINSRVNDISLTNSMPASQQFDMMDGFTSAEAEEDEEDGKEEKEEDEDLEYEREKLFDMKYEELEKEPFDRAPDVAVAGARAIVARRKKSEATSISSSSPSPSSSSSPTPSSSKHNDKSNKRKSKSDHLRRQQQKNQEQQQQQQQQSSHSRNQSHEIKSKLDLIETNAENNLQTILPSIPHQTSTRQSTFYSSLSLSDWDAAGDFLVDELAATLKQFKAARVRKREMARRFEDEVGRRYGDVKEESEKVGRRVKELRVGGEGLLGGGSDVIVDGSGGGVVAVDERG